MGKVNAESVDQRMYFLDLLASVLARHELIRQHCAFEWTGTVKSTRCDDVFEPVWSDPFEEVLHSNGRKLENPSYGSGLQRRKRLGIVLREYVAIVVIFGSIPSGKYLCSDKLASAA